MSAAGLPEAPIYGLGGGIETATEIIFGLLALLSIAYCVIYAIRDRSLIPVYVLLGGFLSCFYEPYADVLGLAIYPEVGTHVFYEMLGRKIPVFVGLIYLFYFPTAIVYLNRKMEQGITYGWWTRFCAFTIGSACIFEILPVHFGLWTYYGAYVDTVHGFPLVWGFLNGQSVVCVAAALHLALRKADARFLPWVIVVVPLLFFGIHFAAAMPLYSALNSTTEPLPIGIATLLSCAVSVIFCGYFGRLVCREVGSKVAK